MIKNLFDADYELFFRLSSLYHVLVVSSVSPVAVPSNPNEKEIRIFSHQFYDVHEDEDYALEVMQKRIQQCPEDIRQHHKHHESMRDALYLIDEFTKEND